MNYNLITSEAPHIKSKDSVKKIMLQVIIALVPAVIASVYFFKIRAVLLIFTCISVSVISEAFFQRLRGKTVSVSDLSAVVTGLLLALVLPPSLPLWVAVVGAVVSIFLGKQVFGGLGSNIFNPALVGRAFLTAAFPVLMTTWIKPFSLDAVTTATPLGLMKFQGVQQETVKLFLGNVSGSLGETSALALIVGGLFLLLIRRIDWRIPLGYLGTVVIFGLMLWFIDSSRYPSVFFELFSGGLMIGAFFMATDPATSPITKKGRWMFGVGCGIILMIIRYWGGLPEGVMYSILFMNALRPLIDRFTRPVCFGGKL